MEILNLQMGENSKGMGPFLQGRLTPQDTIMLAVGGELRSMKWLKMWLGKLYLIELFLHYIFGENFIG